MNTCPVIQDTNRYYAQQDAAQALADYREALIREYRPLILAGHELQINGITYSFEDVRSNCDAFQPKQFDFHLQMMLKGANDAGKCLTEFLEPQLEKVLEEMADSKLEEENDV